jgi:hypothetical protein
MDKGHYIFSDESGWNKDTRFGSLAKISGNYECTKELNNELNNILISFNKKEIKFHGIKGNEQKNIAIEFYKVAFEYLRTNKIKVHILVWDKHDKRHDVKGRDDIENLKRMYFHNLKVLKTHWNIETTWSFFPDEFNQINWEEDVIKYFKNLSLLKSNPNQLQLYTYLSDIKIKYNNVKELQSIYYPIIQLADLFAGAIRTSRNESENFFQWFLQVKNENQFKFFENDNVSVSSNMLPKYYAMKFFKEQSDKYSMGINLSRDRYFKTYNKKSNIFIWHYEPQSDFDKAPLKIQ